MNEIPPITSQTRFWKLSPGENAFLWPQWRDNDYCAIGWPDMGNVVQMNAAQFEARRDEIVRHPEQFEEAHRYTRESVSQLWRFAHEIKPGDRIVANRGTSKVLGLGVVSGPCEFHAQADHYLHRLPVQWFDTVARDVQQGGWRSTLIEINRAKFEAIESGEAIGPMPGNGPTTDGTVTERETPPLNQILYGPPGTGKTYTTIEEAVRIVRGGNMPAAREGETQHAACKRDFDALRAEGRIAFATFHQSFSYEEFVEGIRPVLDDVNETARYICRDGILKDIALRALGAALVPRETGRASFAQVWSDFVEQAGTLPEWLLPGMGPSRYRISVSENGENVTGENVDGKAARPYIATRRNIEAVWEKLPVGVRPSHGALYEILQKGAHTHFIGAIINHLRGAETTLAPRRDKKTDPRDAAKSYLRGSPSYRLEIADAPRFVLIIDEINRGNISKILGELITLLEDDKRLGKENALSVSLPTSGETFALPPNLFVVGTMNTADKSLALLDIALRRRFAFQEMPPRFDDETCPGLSTAQRAVLLQMNLRLTQSRDREHRIGHAYFAGCRSTVEFDRTLRLKIVPLLQEFFYNDWDGLRYVLGEGGANGTFVRALPDGGGRARTRWQWWFDADGFERDAPGFSLFETLVRNYSIPSSNETGGDGE